MPTLKPAASQSIVAPAPPKRPTIARPQPVRDPLPVPVQVTPTVVAVQVDQPSTASHSFGIDSFNTRDPCLLDLLDTVPYPSGFAT